MATSPLLRLPTECLQRIIELAIPESFESLALTCRTLYDASRRFLPIYNPRRKRFRDFWWSQTTKNGEFWARFLNEMIPYEIQDEESQASGWFVPTLLHLLEFIAHEPKLARNDSRGDIDQYDDEDRDMQLPPLERHMSDRLREFVRTSPDLLAAGVDPELWIKSMNTFTRTDRNRDAPHSEVQSTRWAEIFLLTLLPDLRRLQPTCGTSTFCFGDTQHHLSPVIDRMLKRANDSSLDHAALSRLEVVWPSIGYDRGTSRPIPLSACCIFNEIQSLRELYISGCSALNAKEDLEGQPIRPWERFRTRPLPEEPQPRNNRLFSSVMDTTALSEFLALANRASSLRTLRWSWICKNRSNRTNYWDVGAALARIEQHYAVSLEELCLVRLDQCFPICGELPADMAQFRRLKRFQFDIELFHEPKIEAAEEVNGEAVDDNASDDFDSINADTWLNAAPDLTPADRKPCPALVSLLPVTIESVTIRSRDPWSDHSMSALARLLTNFREQRDAKLPRLKSMRVVVPLKEGFTSARTMANKSLERAGGEVVHADLGAWAHNFEARFGLGPMTSLHA